MQAYAPEQFKRQWLDADAVLGTWERIEPWYRKLLEWEIASSEELIKWLSASDELDAAVSEEGVERYISMTCQTDDPERERAHLEFVREIEPKVKIVRNEVRAKYLSCPHRSGLPRDYYQVYDRAEQLRSDLFRETNVHKETELAELKQRYQKIIGAMTVVFQGEERTPQRMGRFLEETDAKVRKEAWETTAKRRLQDREALDDLFDGMLRLRVEIAKEAGFENFVDYAYKSLERFDYGVKEAEAFQEAVELAIVPLARSINEERRRRLGLESLKPWDLAVDPLGRPPLRPFEDVSLLASGAGSIFDSIDPELGARFEYLRKGGLLDLANRKGKAPGGYQTTLQDKRMPFIFMNAVGVDNDVRTLLHEGGHAFHTLACRDQSLAAYRDCPMEFCEVASMTMELFGARDLGVFYGVQDANRSYRQLLEGTVLIMPWIAQVDAFQHWIYRNPEKSRAERAKAWIELERRFGGTVDWSGLEEILESSWHKQLHIFLYPFYYIEYGIAQLGALQLWRRGLQDKAAAVRDYRRALTLGGSKPLPELFEAAGIEFDFGARVVEPLMARVQAELKLLSLDERA